MQGFCCIEGLLGTSKQLCAAVHVRVDGLPQGQEHEVGCRGCAGPLGHGRSRWRPSLFMDIYLHSNISIAFHCGRDARTTARNVPSPPHPHFFDMRRAYANKISLRLCSCFVVHTIGGRLLKRFPRSHSCQETHHGGQESSCHSRSSGRLAGVDLALVCVCMQQSPT